MSLKNILRAVSTIAISAFMLTGCAASFVKHEPDAKTVTFGRETGSVAEDGLYRASFTSEAERLCPNGYTLVERSRHPSTLKDVGVEASDKNFYWVVRCK